MAPGVAPGGATAATLELPTRSALRWLVSASGLFAYRRCLPSTDTARSGAMTLLAAMRDPRA